MPYKHESEGRHLPPDKDRRRKLTPEERQAIRDNPEGLGPTALAQRYRVSKRLVQFIRHPERLRANLEARAARGGWRQYYDVEEHREAMKSTRQHRTQTFKAAAIPGAGSENQPPHTPCADSEKGE